MMPQQFTKIGHLQSRVNFGEILCNIVVQIHNDRRVQRNMHFFVSIFSLKIQSTAQWYLYH